MPQPGAHSALPVRFFIAYGPTDPLAQSNPTICDKFYDFLSRAWTSCARRTIVIGLGDFNSKVGIGTAGDVATCIGPYSKGSRNENGQVLVEWANMHQLLFANTLFRYYRYRTTLRGTILALMA